MKGPLGILIEVVHPADVLFFLNPMRMLQASGHRVFIASRDKDVALQLLDEFEFDHRCLSRARSGILGLGVELIARDLALWRFVKECRPDVMAGFGGVAISHVGRLMGIPAIGFYDTDKAVLQQWITLPFIDRQYVSDVYDGPTARRRTARFRGIKELSYLHPDNFVPDRTRAIAAGLDPDRANFLLRIVHWGANHDLGKRGWSGETLRKTVTHLERRGRVHICAEKALPAELERLRYRGRPSDFHHLLAHCDIYVGESATIAAEAFLLGVPAIYAVDDRRSYIDALEQRELIVQEKDGSPQALIDAIERELARDRQQWHAARRRWLREQDRLANFIVSAILAHGYGSESAAAS